MMTRGRYGVLKRFHAHKYSLQMDVQPLFMDDGRLGIPFRALLVCIVRDAYFDKGANRGTANARLVRTWESVLDESIAASPMGRRLVGKLTSEGILPRSFSPEAPGVDEHRPAGSPRSMLDARRGELEEESDSQPKIGAGEALAAYALASAFAARLRRRSSRRARTSAEDAISRARMSLADGGTQLHSCSAGRASPVASSVASVAAAAIKEGESSPASSPSKAPSEAEPKAAAPMW